jgi:hypothetical protein
VLWISQFSGPSASEGKDLSFAVKAFCYEREPASFELYLRAGDCPLKTARVTWIAIDADIEDIASGQIDIKAGSQKKITGRVSYPTGVFDSPPKIFIAVGELSWAKNSDLQFACAAGDISEEDFEYTFETWGDSTCEGATLYWVAVP